GRPARQRRRVDRPHAAHVAWGVSLFSFSRSIFNRPKTGPGRLVVAAVTATLGCNGGGAASGGTDTDTGTGTGTGTGAEALAFADFFAVAEQAYCGWATRCGAFASVEACDAVQFFDVVYPRNLLGMGIFTDLGQSDVAV